VPVFLTHYTVTRKDGVTFLVCYVLYLVYVVLSAQQSPFLANIMPILLSVLAACLTLWMWSLVSYLRKHAD